MIFSRDCLAGRHILVTGASSGLGRAAAIGMAEVGARLILVGRNEARLEETREALGGDGHVTIAAELTEVEGTAELVRSAAKAHGALDGVFHSAGITLTQPLKLAKQRHVQEVFGPSVYGALGIVRAAAQKDVMTERSAVVLMSSISALRGYHGMGVYSAAKSAVHGLVRASAIELAGKGVRVNTIVSGAIFTEMFAAEAERMGSDWVGKVAARHPMGFGAPDDITSAVIFLMSDGGKWITGTDLVIDGGYTAL